MYFWHLRALELAWFSLVPEVELPTTEQPPCILQISASAGRWHTYPHYSRMFAPSGMIATTAFIVP
jgi:hypothetical protein